MNLKKLKEPFSETDIEWRVSRSGEKNGKIWCMVLAYITNRAIMDRLDDVCGPNGWKNEYKSAPEGGILCGVSIKCGDEWITKWDGAENTNVEAIKGGLSGAMKRAGVQWGIGRYLYGLTENFGKVVDNGRFSATIGKGNDRKYYKWNPPVLPEWALPETPKIKLNKLMNNHGLSDSDKKSVVEWHCRNNQIVNPVDETYKDIYLGFKDIFENYLTAIK
jgi:hypothetical protein